jgi:hypothetical protein
MRPLSAIISVVQSLDEEQETDLEVIEQGLHTIAKLFVQQSGLLTDGRTFFDDDEMRLLTDAADRNEPHNTLFGTFLGVIEDLDTA